jgi:hypothetical protein
MAVDEFKEKAQRRLNIAVERYTSLTILIERANKNECKCTAFTCKNCLLIQEIEELMLDLEKHHT